MLDNEKSRYLTSCLCALSSWDFKVALGIAVLTTATSALRLCYYIGYSVSTYEHMNSTGVSSYAVWSIDFLEEKLLAITIGLFVSMIGIWSRKALGFFLSLLGLAWVGIAYVLWHLGTLSIMRANEIKDFSQMPNQGQYVLALDYATWLDLVILTLAITLFAWQVKTLTHILSSAHSKSSFSV